MKLAKKVMLSLIAILSVAICSVIAFVGSNYKESVVGSTTNGSASSSEVNIDEITSNEKPSTITYAPDTISVQKGGSTLNYAYSPSVNAKDSTSTIAYEYIFGNTMNRATAVNLKSIDTTGVNVSYAYSTTKLDTSSEITGETDYTLQKLENKGSKVYIYVIVSPTDETIPTTFTTSIVWYYGIPQELKIVDNVTNNVVASQTIVSGQYIDTEMLTEPEAEDGYYFDAWFTDKEFTQLVESEVRANQKIYARYYNIEPLSTDYMTYSDGSYSVTGDPGLDNFIVPTIYDDGVNGKAKVTTICEVFSGGSSTSLITLPYTITTIESYAFYDSGMSVDLTSCVNLVTIEEYALGGEYSSYAPSLINLDLSKCVNLTTLGDGAFCRNESILNMDLSNCTKLTSLENEVFSECSLLINIMIPSTITSIGEYTFQSCHSLTDITLPNSVISIGDSAFSDCNKLTNIIIPSNVTSIESFVFHCCTSLTTITIPSGVTNIGDSAFSRSGLTSIIIPSNVTSIGNEAFGGCNSLTSISFPSTITSIGNKTFYGCNALTSITIPSSVTSIGDDAFRDSGLTSITIPSSVTGIGKSPFSGCSELTSIVVAEGNSVYDSRNNCNAIIETSTNTLIQGCNTTIIPNDVTSIGQYAFYGCSSLITITISNNVTSIGRYAFYGCSSLTTITIPASVTKIYQNAFSYCDSLTSVICEDTTTWYESYMGEDTQIDVSDPASTASRFKYYDKYEDTLWYKE